MNKKLIIQLSIIVVAFAAAGVVLYNGFFKSSQPSVPVAATAAVSGSEITPQTILPNGSTLDFSVVNSGRFVFNQLQYPQLNPSSEVGVPENTLISSLTSGAK